MILASRIQGMLVVDASVATKWYLRHELHAELAEELLRAHRADRIELIAPAHILYEVPATIHAATLGRQPRLSRAEGRLAIDSFLELHLRTNDGDTLPREVYELAQLSDASVY